jgi:hypothetical protein
MAGFGPPFFCWSCSATVHAHGGPLLFAVGGEVRRESMYVKSTENVVQAQIIGRGSLWIDGQRNLVRGVHGIGLVPVFFVRVLVPRPVGCAQTPRARGR